MAHEREAPEYVVEHVREALATDARVGQMDLDVSIAGDRILLSGRVPTEERRAAIDDAVAAAAPGWEIHNGTVVEELHASDVVENLP